MNLFVLTGAVVAPKLQLAGELVQWLRAQGRSVSVLDNGDKALRLADVPTVRLAAGCVCCSIATQLARAVRRAETNAVVTPVSALADPEALALVLDSLRGPQRHITTLALIDQSTRTRFPHLAEQLALFADHVVSEPFSFDLPVLTSELVSDPQMAQGVDTH